MAGIIALRKIEIGAEVSYGAGTAPTTTWRGMGIGEDKREIKHVEEQIGIAIPTTRAYVPKEEGEVVFNPIEATFDQLPYILNAGIDEATPTQDGAGTGYVYSYAMPTTAQNSPLTYTINAGDDESQLYMGGCFVKSFKITGNAGEGVMMDATWGAYDVALNTSPVGTAVPALVASDNIVFGGSKLYIDAVGGTIGTTEKTVTLLSFELDVTTGLKAKWTNEAKNSSFVYFDSGEYSATLKLVYENNAVGRAEAAIYQAATPQQLRLEFDGAALGTGATYNTKTLLIDAAGIYTAMPYGDVEGNSTFEAELQIGYDVTAALGLEFVVVNELTTLP